MNFELPLAFVFAALIMELTPGPNMGYLAIVAARTGRRAGTAAVLGTTLGLLTYLLASVAGLAEAALRWPSALQALKWAGVAYLLWLAWEAWRGEQTRQPDDGEALRGFFLRGLMANLLNPKAALLYVTILPGFIEPGSDTRWRALYLGGVHIGISVVVHMTIVLGAATMTTWLVENSPAERRIRRSMALALVGVAAWLASPQDP